jgi:hypothetical protein
VDEDDVHYVIIILRGYPPPRVVLRKVIILVLAVIGPAAPAFAQDAPKTLLMPGVSYSRELEFTRHGPVVMHVIEAPRPGGLYSLAPVLSNELIVGRERVTEMERRVSSAGTVTGVNGDLFTAEGHPSGILLRNGVLDRVPTRDRSSVGIGADGTLRIERVDYAGYYRGNGQRRAITLNALAPPNGVALFTPSWGMVTPGVPSYEVVLRPFSAARPNTDLVGTAVSAGSTNGSTAIPPDGAILQARGSAAPKLAAEVAVGSEVALRVQLTPSWEGVTHAVGGGPAIVRDGKAVFRANEIFGASLLTARSARTAIGQRANGRILLVAVDGNRQGYSAGMTNFELALALLRLGAVNASALDSGDSTTMAFDGQLLNRPSEPGGELPVAEALLVSYAGVYAPPPVEPVLSPNQDGVAEQQALAYKLVRPSTVTARLIAPDGSTREVDTGAREPGVYRFGWDGYVAGSKTVSEREGRWRFTVTATDAAGQTSAADRYFFLNNTLQSLSVAQALVRLGGGGLRASFTVRRKAKVTITIENASGIVLRVLARSRTLTPGQHRVTWDGRDGSGNLVRGGKLGVHVVATNGLGRVDLRDTFRARR